jgi:transposase
MKELYQRFVGIDLGKRSMSVHFINHHEKHESWNCLTDADGRLRLLKRLTSLDIIAMEACPLAFILQVLISKNVGAKVLVLNPHGLALIYRSTKKTDREDAAKLAWVIQRLPENELPIVTIPSQNEQEFRSLVAEQVHLAHSRTSEINRLHALFVQDGITTVTKKDLHTVQNRSIRYAELSSSASIHAVRLEKIISCFEQNLAEVESRICTLVAQHVLTPYLMSLPGVGPNLVAAFIGYIGDGKRFKLNTVTAYAGLVPRVDCSGDSNKYGPITKRGCTPLRRALVQAAWALSRSSNSGVLGIKYQQLLLIKGKSKAIVAIARKMLETMWTLATRKEYYLDFDPVRYHRKMVRYNIQLIGGSGVA